MINTKLTELPNHGHYTVCAGRMYEIKRTGKLCFGASAVICVLLLILTWLTFRFSIISMIPNLIGDGGDPAANMVQTLIVLAMLLLACMGTGKYKICHVLLFVLYCAMLISCAFSRNASDVFTVILSLAGIIFSWKIPMACFDYNQLRLTEGFPDFNERLTYQNEHSEYEALHGCKHYSKGAQMAEPEIVQNAVSERKDDSEYKMEDI